MGRKFNIGASLVATAGLSAGAGALWERTRNETSSPSADTVAESPHSSSETTIITTAGTLATTTTLASPEAGYGVVVCTVPAEASPPVVIDHRASFPPTEAFPNGSHSVLKAIDVNRPGANASQLPKVVAYSVAAKIATASGLVGYDTAAELDNFPLINALVASGCTYQGPNDAGEHVIVNF